MNPNPLVILHGWSDTSKSFRPLATWLKRQGFNVVPIFLGDYLSMNDEVTLKDLGSALQIALKANGVPQGPHAFDVIVHSTGGLVIREYLRQVCAGSPQNTPVQNLLMFSPANFGSPLAALGKSVIGRLFGGWGWDHLGQTGQAILEGLELASPYSWDLAMADLFDDQNSVFDPANTLVTVIVGTAAFSGIKSIVHENGSDGTVRVSTASLNASLLRVDCETASQIKWKLVEKNCPPLALAVLDRDHSASHDPADKRQQAEWAEVVLAALTTAPAKYPALVARCAQISAQTFAAGQAGSEPEQYHEYQTLVVRVHDQFGDPVPDYVLEFYQEKNDAADRVFTAMNTDLLEKVTKNSVDPSYRSFLFDITALRAFLVQHPKTAMEMSLTAAGISERISYRNPEGGIAVFTGLGQKLMRPNAPLLIDITLYRDTSAKVFKLTRLP